MHRDHGEGRSGSSEGVAHDGVDAEGGFDLDYVRTAAGDFADEGFGARVGFEDGGEGFQAFADGAAEEVGEGGAEVGVAPVALAPAVGEVGLLAGLGEGPGYGGEVGAGGPRRAPRALGGGEGADIG